MRNKFSQSRRVPGGRGPDRSRETSREKDLEEDMPPEATQSEGRVRIARMQEIDRVAALWSLITEHHADLDPYFRMRQGPIAEGELRELLRTLQRDPDAVILVWDENDTPQGLCIVRIDRAPPILEETERAEITDLGVRPDLRRQGVARELVGEAQAWIRDRGVSRVEIQVARGNVEGQAFWRAMGYGELMDVLHKRL